MNLDDERAEMIFSGVITLLKWLTVIIMTSIFIYTVWVKAPKQPVKHSPKQNTTAKWK